MAALSIQTIVEAGVTPSYASCAGGGDTAANAMGDVLLHVKNGSGGALTVTVTAQKTTGEVPGMGSLAKSNVAVSVGAGSEEMIGPFGPLAFNNSSGLLAITYSGVTSLTIAAIKLPRVA